MLKKPITALDLLESRVLAFHEEARLLRQGQMCRPRFALIYPTYVCNHACVGCDYADYNSMAAPALLSGKELDSVIDQVAEVGVRAVEFCGGGEPLLHPDIDQAIRKVRSLGMKLGLLTNGTEISAARADLLVTSCSYVRVSIEAGQESTFLRIKRPKAGAAGFAQVRHNVALLVQARRRLESTCQVSLKFTVGEGNKTELEAAIVLAAELGVDSIQFKCLRNVPSELPLDEKRALNRELERLRGKYPGLRIIGDLLPYQVDVPCWLSPLHVMIDAKGDAFVCCYYRHRADRHRYGNVFETRLRDLWGSPAHREALRNIRKEECEKYDCRFIKYARLMDQALRHGELDFL